MCVCACLSVRLSVCLSVYACSYTCECLCVQLLQRHHREAGGVPAVPGHLAGVRPLRSQLLRHLVWLLVRGAIGPQAFAHRKLCWYVIVSLAVSLSSVRLPPCLCFCLSLSLSALPPHLSFCLCLSFCLSVSPSRPLPPMVTTMRKMTMATATLVKKTYLKEPRRRPLGTRQKVELNNSFL